MWWLILLGAIVLFLMVIVLRALRFRPGAEQKADPAPVAVDGEKAIADLQAMIRCKTVSYYQEGLADEAEFERFRALLKTLYPRVHEACAPERIGKSGLLYTLRGKSSDRPAVFMAHYDVVPANEALWDRPPFEAVIEDGMLWGRGTLDTKTTLCGVMEAAETLLAEGFVPENDLYFAFAGDEEIAGDTQPAIVETLRARGVVPALVLDEGGAVVENVFPGVAQPCALIGIGEKGMMNLRLSCAGAGGHASAPKPHTPVGVLADAVVKVENHPFPRRLTKPVAEMFDTLGRRSSFAYRVIFANLWCFLPLLDLICKRSGGELNAMMRTTCAFTEMKGSSANNVIPPEASVGANLRLIGGETIDSAIAYVERAIGNPAVKAEFVQGMNPSKNSETRGYGWETVKRAVSETWPEAVVSPYLMVACSDSRHYCAISDNVYRFSAMALTAGERATIHGNNERIPLDKIVRTVEFYLRLMKRC